MKFPTSRLVVSAVSLLAGFAAHSHAATFTWNGATDTAFLTPGNWVGGVAPANSNATDIALFAGAPTANAPTLTAARGINGLRFTTATGGWTFEDPTAVQLSLGSGGISTAGQTSGTNTINVRMSIAAAQTWEVGTGGTLVLNGSLVSAGRNVTVGSLGNEGTLVLNPATVSYIGASGTMFLNYGQINFNKSTSLGGDNGTLAIGNGTRIDNSSGAAVTFANSSLYNIIVNGDFGYVGTNALGTGTSAVSLGSAAGTSRTITTLANNLTIGGVISNGATATSLVKAGSGTMTLAGANAFTGTLSVAAGSLAVAEVNNASAAGALGNSANAVVLGSSGTTGTLLYTGVSASSNKAFTMASSGTGAFNVSTGAANLTLSGLVNGSGALLKVGSGTLSLTNASNSYSGGTVLGAGTLSFVNGALGSSGDITFAGGTLLYGAGANQDLSARFNNNTSAILVNTGTETNSIVFSNAISSSNTGGLTKVGAGTLTLAVANNYIGNTTITGAVVIGDKGAFSTGDVIVSGGAAILSATTDLTGANKLMNNFTLVNNLTNATNSASIEYGGNVNLNGTAKSVTNNTVASTSTFSGIISNDAGAGITFVSSGTIALTGINTFSGTASFRGDRALVVSQINNAGVAGNLGQGSVLRFGSNTPTGAYLKYTGVGETTNRSLEWATTTGNINLEHAGTGLLHFTGTTTTASAGAKALNLIASNSGTGQLDGSLADNGGALSVSKSGVGTWILAGNNVYTGTTSVTAGTLILNGSNVSSVTVSSGATLGGSGSTTGSVTVASGGILAPGNSPGILSTGNLSLAGTLASQIGKGGAGQPIAGTDYDQVNVTGSVTLTGGNLQVSLLTGIQNGDLYFIIANNDSDAITGFFASLNGVATDLTQDAIFTVGAQQFQISYVGNSTGGTFLGGNDVALLAVPEPSTWALLGLGFGALLWRSGARRRSS